MGFQTKSDLPLSTRQEIDRVQAIAAGLRTTAEAALLVSVAPYLTNEVIQRNAANEIVIAKGTTVPVSGTTGFAKGALFMKSDAADGAEGIYENIGTCASGTFILRGVGEQDRTATADGTGTGAISSGVSHVVVTSASATNQISLPASSADLLGKMITIWVGANGIELITPAGSNATINNLDSDGTNQVDIPANTLSRVTLVATDKWILENLTALGAVTTALIPDND